MISWKLEDELEDEEAIGGLRRASPKVDLFFHYGNHWEWRSCLFLWMQSATD